MRKGLSTILTVGIVVVVMLALGIGAYVFLTNKTQPQAKTEDTSNNDRSSEDSSATVRPFLIYAETISETTTPDRSWPTVSIYKTSDGSDKELLATVGKVGEYPGRFFLTPDKSKLLIGLESKLQILDLETKQLDDLLVAKNEIGDLVFSPDGKEALIWDQKYASNDLSYTLHRFNLSTKSDAIIKSGVMSEKPAYLSPYSWRSDNKIAMLEPMGEAADFWYLDMDSLEIKQSTVGPIGSSFAGGRNSKLMATPSTTIADICNEMSGVGPNSYDFIDNVSGSKSGNVAATASLMTPVGFSPDDTEFIYYTTVPAKNASECNSPRTKSYFKVSVASGQPAPLDNLVEQLRIWDTNNIGVEYAYSKDDELNQLVIGHKIVASSAKSLQIVAQYWK